MQQRRDVRPTAIALLFEALPRMDWDDEMRAAGACMLSAYSDKVGEDGVAVMIADMEAFATDIDAMTAPDVTDVTFVPSGIPEAEFYGVMTSCGMMRLQVKRMDESGLAAAVASAGDALNWGPLRARDTPRCRITPCVRRSDCLPTGS